MALYSFPKWHRPLYITLPLTISSLTNSAFYAIIFVAVRESNKIGFVGQILPITAVLSLIILIYDRRKEPCSRKNLLRQNCFAPHGELIFDEFWWDFAKQGINLASKSTPKDTKSNRREAIRFDSRTATFFRKVNFNENLKNYRNYTAYRLVFLPFCGLQWGRTRKYNNRSYRARDNRARGRTKSPRFGR